MPSKPSAYERAAHKPSGILIGTEVELLSKIVPKQLIGAGCIVLRPPTTTRRPFPFQTKRRLRRHRFSGKSRSMS